MWRMSREMSKESNYIDFYMREAQLIETVPFVFAKGMI